VTTLGWDDVLRKKPRPPRFALEIFAGTARITKALHTVGFYAFPIDICIAEHHNLLDTYVEHDILHLLQSGRVSFLWLGMPCTSFSRARKWDGLGPGPLRDLFHLNGFSWLNDADKKKVRTGNDLLRVSLRFLQVCEQLSIPYALENPSSSYAWEMPQMKRFISHFSPKFAWLDFCQYGEDWKKPTTIMGNFWSISQLSKQCSTLHGLCSRTQRPHFALTGTDENNIFWTLRAQPYPHELCQKVAAVLAKDMAK
jgi:hypothetical protein